MRTAREIRERIQKIESLDADDYDGYEPGTEVKDAEYYGYREALLWVLEEDTNDPFE